MPSVKGLNAATAPTFGPLPDTRCLDQHRRYVRNYPTKTTDEQRLKRCFLSGFLTGVGLTGKSPPRVKIFSGETTMSFRNASLVTASVFGALLGLGSIDSALAGHGGHGYGPGYGHGGYHGNSAKPGYYGYGAYPPGAA